MSRDSCLSATTAPSSRPSRSSGPQPSSRRRSDALVVCVWQPADVGFTPVGDQHFDADQAPEVRTAAEEVAAHGAKLAERPGFTARGLAVEASPIWQGIVTAAEDEGASLIVLGAHRHGVLASAARACHPGGAGSLLRVRPGRA